MKNKSLIVIGAANIDRLGTVRDTYYANDSNPGFVNTYPGGVGRNIAHNLGLLDLKPTFVTGLGNDQAGAYITEVMTTSKVNVIKVPIEKTSEYLAMFDENSKLVGAINAMAPFEAFELPSNLDLNYDYTVIDLNINDQTIQSILAHSTRLFVDGTSAQKVNKIMPYLKQIDYLKINDIEAKALTTLPINTLDNLKACAAKIHDLGVKTVLLTIGALGLIVADETGVKHYPAPKGKITNTSGAGDAFLSGYLFGLIQGLDPVKTALTVALITCETKDSVNINLSSILVKKRLETIVWKLK